ncbi:MAG: heme ABC transporter permease [Pseudomonadota bacterium]
MKAFTEFSNPAKFEALARTVSPYAFGVFLVAGAIGLAVSLFFSPPDYQQGNAVRVMYVHVPAAWMATIAYTFLAAMSAIAFVWRHNVADVAARAAALPGAVFTALALFTGAIWGKPTWGAWWVWDARLTSVLVLLFVYIGYMAVWRSMTDKARAARFARIVALVGFINIPIIKFSVDWWNSLHQPASIIRAGGPSVDGSMLTPLVTMLIAYTAFFVWLVLTGVRAELISVRRDARFRRAPRSVSTVRTVEGAVSDA